MTNRAGFLLTVRTTEIETISRADFAAKKDIELHSAQKEETNVPTATGQITQSTNADRRRERKKWRAEEEIVW